MVKAQRQLSPTQLPVRAGLGSRDGGLERQVVVFIRKNCERCEYVYLKCKPEMRSSCDENVAQMSCPEDGLGTLPGDKKKILHSKRLYIFYKGVRCD